MATTLRGRPREKRRRCSADGAEEEPSEAELAMLSPDELHRRGLALMEAGRLEEAGLMFERVLCSSL